MPKYGIHHIVLDSCKEQLVSENNNIGEILEDNSAIAKLGSIGPDLFFWGPDYKIVDIYLKLYENLKDIAEIYEELMEPIEEFNEKYVEPVEETVEEFIELNFNTTYKLIIKLEEVKKATGRYCESAKMSTIFAGVIEGLDVANFGTVINTFFQQFEPEHFYNRPEIDWYWFDMLHYRQSGTFAQKLIELADSNKKKAYAYGYLTHIATDVTGHPFVNQMVGAPYRSNIWRHVTVESFLDTWKFEQYYNGESINEKLRERLELPEIKDYLNDDTPLDDEIVDLLFEAFNETYSKVLHPIRLNEDGFYSKDDIQNTYKVFVQFTNYIEDSYVSPPEEPFTDVMDILADALSGRLPEPPAMPATNPTNSSCTWQDIFSPSPHCQDDLTEIIEEWTRYALELTEWLGHVAAAIVDTLVAVALAMPVMTFMALLYGIQLVAYEIYRMTRMILSLHGLVLPEPDELNWGISERLTTLQGACWEKAYPSTGMPSKSNLECPVDFVENFPTKASFYTNTNTPHGHFPHPLPFPHPFPHIRRNHLNADSFIGEAGQDINFDNLKNYVDCTSPVNTRALLDQNKIIGNAIPLSLWMIRNATNQSLEKYVFANWNLDSDRGYGYKEWHGFQSKALNHDQSVSPELYIENPHTHSIGDDCFNLFSSAVGASNKPNLTNAYLLSIACQFDYLDQLYIPTPWDANAVDLYKTKFMNLMGRWGLDTARFKFISNSNSEADTQVVIMPNRDTNNPFIIVLFRGSESPVSPDKAFKDWITSDFNAYPPTDSEIIPDEDILSNAQVQFHKGFWEAFNLVKKDIQDKIQEIKNLNPGVDYKVWVTGNSLGAALANICGLWLEIHDCPVEGVYTFAAPKCANQAFSNLYEDYLTGRCHRWVNGRLDSNIDHRDIVTQVPPSCSMTIYDADLINYSTILPNPPNTSTITLTFPYCFSHVGIEHLVDETDDYLFSGFPLPTKVRAHFTEGYSRGIYIQLDEDVAQQVPLPSL